MSPATVRHARTLQLDPDNGQKRPAHRRRRDQRDQTPDHPGRLETPYPFQGGGRRQADGVGQRLVGDRTVHLQQPQYLPIDRVQRPLEALWRLISN